MRGDRIRWTAAGPSSSAAAASRSSTRGSSATAARSTGPDVAGGAIAGVLAARGPAGLRRQQHLRRPRRARPTRCSNGGAISSIGVSWTIINSRFIHNRAVGHGAQPTPARHAGRRQRRSDLQRRQHDDAASRRLDGQGQPLQRRRWQRHLLRQQRPPGEVEIAGSVLRNNSGDGFSTHPGIFFLGRRIPFTDSVVE